MTGLLSRWLGGTSLARKLHWGNLSLLVLISKPTMLMKLARIAPWTLYLATPWTHTRVPTDRTLSVVLAWIAWALVWHVALGWELGGVALRWKMGHDAMARRIVGARRLSVVTLLTCLSSFSRLKRTHFLTVCM